MMNNNDDELNYAYENGMENNQTKTKMGKKSRNQEGGGGNHRGK